MDILTQGILGAATAQAGAKQPEARIAAAVGFFAGMLPDADALIRSSEDPLLVLEYHRHFTHALIFIPFAALLAAVLLWPFVRKPLSFTRLYLFAFLGVALAGLLDACTSYGTHLLWPFSDQRIAWSIIAIVDPVFTLLLTVPLSLALLKHKPALARMGLLLAGVYLCFGVLQQQRVYALAEEVIAGRGHLAERLLVKPTMGNLLLWRSVYVANARIYADGIRAGFIGGTKVYPGASLPQLEPDAFLLIPEDSKAMQDLRRFDRFSDGWIAHQPEQPGYIGDMRYAMLPTSTLPLWGIMIDIQNPDLPPQFVTQRKFSPALRQQFIDMLWGRNLIKSESE